MAERLWSGAATAITPSGIRVVETELMLEEYAPGVAFVPGYANVVAFDTAEGLLLIDSGTAEQAAAIHQRIRAWSAKPLHTVLFTHGHVDHVFGLAPFEEEARREGWPPPRVVAHANVPLRFDRYILTNGLNAQINARQFRTPHPTWPTAYRYPDLTFHDTLTVTVGDERIELTHGRGETDDHCWAWVPARRVLCTGDFFIWVAPNCGNPHKVQRYAREWALTLRTMAALGAETLFPGHGLPIQGADRIRQALEETAEFLETIHDQTLAMMNAGAPLDAILQTVRVPTHLMERPYLHPVYDEPEFIVRNIWRLYAGWYDGNPAHLKPGSEQRLAEEIAALAGGAMHLAARAVILADAGEFALACHLAEYAARAAPEDVTIRDMRASVYRRRAASETSLMARSLYRVAADEPVPATPREAPVREGK